MQAIARLRRGFLSRQCFKSPGHPATRRGPYYVLQGYFRGQKLSERVPPEQAAQAQQDVEKYRRFQTLAEEYVTVSDRLACLQDKRPKRPPPPGSSKPPPSRTASAKTLPTTAWPSRDARSSGW